MSRIRASSSVSAASLWRCGCIMPLLPSKHFDDHKEYRAKSVPASRTPDTGGSDDNFQYYIAKPEEWQPETAGFFKRCCRFNINHDFIGWSYGTFWTFIVCKSLGLLVSDCRSSHFIIGAKNGACRWRNKEPGRSRTLEDSSCLQWEGVFWYFEDTIILSMEYSSKRASYSKKCHSSESALEVANVSRWSKHIGSWLKASLNILFARNSSWFSSCGHPWECQAYIFLWNRSF